MVRDKCLVGHTQKQSVEFLVQSDEEAFRTKFYPTVNDRIKIHTVYTQKKVKEQALLAKVEENKRKWENLLSNQVIYFSNIYISCCHYICVVVPTVTIEVSV